MALVQTVRAIECAVAIICIAATAACATPKSVDPIPAQGTISHSITWVLADDAVQACSDSLGKPLIGTRLACAWLRGNECAIYILGHEALHCFVGNFHYAVN